MYDADLAYVHDAGFSEFARHVAPELVAILRAHGVRRGTIVDAGCGSGVLAEALVRAGYHLRGFDISAAMVRLARARVPQARFGVGSLATVRMPRADAVIALNEVVNYVDRAAALDSFFARAYRALRPGGLLIFDFIASAEHRTYPGKSRSGRDWAIAVRAQTNRSGRVLTRHITTFRKIGPGDYRKNSEIHRVLIHSRERIARALTAIGFRVRMRRSYGGRRLLPGDYAVIAQKPVGSREGEEQHVGPIAHLRRRARRPERRNGRRRRPH